MMNESPGVTYKCNERDDAGPHATSIVSGSQTARVEMTAASVNRLAHVITLAQVCPVRGS
jgi:hypothetical protein